MGKHPAWKKAEETAARDLGTTRTPLSGSGSRHTGGDTLHETLYIEVKYRASFSVLVLYRKTKDLARRENKIPILCLKEKARHGKVAVLDWDLFVELWKSHSLQVSKSHSLQVSKSHNQEERKV